MRLETVWITFFVCFLTAGEKAWAVAIEVSSGDTLSAVAQRYKNDSERIYGKHGFLAQILSLNPHIQNPHSIAPGTRITLPESVKMTRMVAAEEKSAEPSQPESQPPPQIQPSPQPQVTDFVCKSEKTLDRDVAFALGIDFVYSKIEARDVLSGGKASYVSDLMNRYRLSLVMEIVPQILWKTEFSIQKNKYLSPDATITLNDAPDTKRGEVSLEKIWDSGFHAQVSGGIRQQIFVRRESASLYQWDLSTIPFIGLGIGYDFANWRNHTLGVSGRFNYLMSQGSGVQKIQEGTQSEFDLHLRTQKNGLLLQQHVGVSYESQDSEIVEQKMTEVLFGFSLGYAF
ncbi:LysM peptidoglycan-binding domain-containing protein [Bdellovibrio sp. GT3]|uniref:LysM peptidoglycan-binding domain-containing protein n=1 Tax=Bdellovibrio sp. GT3 TaxID=3136282 RepID=UPI0030EFB335